MLSERGTVCDLSANRVAVVAFQRVRDGLEIDHPLCSVAVTILVGLCADDDYFVWVARVALFHFAE